MTDNNLHIYKMLASGNYVGIESNIYVGDSSYIWTDENDNNWLLVSPATEREFLDWLEERPLLKALL
jgi:hypothetical protein